MQFTFFAVYLSGIVTKATSWPQKGAHRS